MEASRDRINADQELHLSAVTLSFSNCVPPALLWFNPIPVELFFENHPLPDAGFDREG
jgi:hypothetical protein